MAAGFLVALILFYVFETDGIFEYARFLRIPLPFLFEYENILQNGGNSHYVKFLRGIYSENFWIRAATCPVCLSFYLSAGFAIFSLNPGGYPEIHFTGLCAYFGLKILAKFSS